MNTINSNERLVKIKTVMEYVEFSKSKIYDLISKNQFPKPIKIGSSSLWKFSDIQAFIDEKIKI